MYILRFIPNCNLCSCSQLHSQDSSLLSKTKHSKVITIHCGAVAYVEWAWSLTASPKGQVCTVQKLSRHRTLQLAARTKRTEVERWASPRRWAEARALPQVAVCVEVPTQLWNLHMHCSEERGDCPSADCLVQFSSLDSPDLFKTRGRHSIVFFPKEKEMCPKWWFKMKSSKSTHHSLFHTFFFKGQGSCV